MRTTKLDTLMMAAGLLAMGVLAAAWLVNALRPHPAASAAVRTTVIKLHTAAPAPTPRLVALALAATSPASSPTPPTYNDARNSFRIIEATYGVKQNGHQWHTRVDDRAYDLLRHKGWLKVSPDYLGADPRPYHAKLLYLDYEVLGKEAVMIRREHQGLTLHQLIMHAGVLPARTADPDPAAAAAAGTDSEIVVESSDGEAVDVQTAATHETDRPK